VSCLRVCVCVCVRVIIARLKLQVSQFSSIHPSEAGRHLNAHTDTRTHTQVMQTRLSSKPSPQAGRQPDIHSVSQSMNRAGSIQTLLFNTHTHTHMSATSLNEPAGHALTHLSQQVGRRAACTDRQTDRRGGREGGRQADGNTQQAGNRPSIHPSGVPHSQGKKKTAKHPTPIPTHFTPSHPPDPLPAARHNTRPP